MDAEQILTIDSGQGVDLNYEIAGVGARAYAFTIDWHIRVLIALGWMLVGLLLRWLTGATALLVVLPAALLYLLYHPILELLLKGSTPGKKKAGVRIVTLEGLVPTPLQIFIRNVFRIIDSLPLFYGVGIVACVCNKSAQRLGDMAAGTLLVYQEDEREIAESVAMYASGALSIGESNAVRSLLDRWEELNPPVQVALSQRLLAKLGRPTRRDDAGILKRELETVLKPGQAGG